MMALQQPNRDRDLVSMLLLVIVLGLVSIALFASSGCTAIEKLPPGAQLQSSTVGIRVSPQSLDGTPLMFGSHTAIITTSQPADAGPNLNRFEGKAPGVNVRSTVATGAVGEQIEAAGGADALQYLMNPGEVRGPSPFQPVEVPE